MSINECALNFLLFLVACFTEDQYIWYHTSAKVQKPNLNIAVTQNLFSLTFSANS